MRFFCQEYFLSPLNCNCCEILGIKRKNLLLSVQKNSWVSRTSGCKCPTIKLVSSETRDLSHKRVVFLSIHLADFLFWLNRLQYQHRQCFRATCGSNDLLLQRHIFVSLNILFWQTHKLYNTVLYQKRGWQIWRVSSQSLSCFKKTEYQKPW